MTDKQEYTLKDGTEKVRRSGLVLDAGQTIEAYSDILGEHGDVLEPVGETDADGEETDE